MEKLMKVNTLTNEAMQTFRTNLTKCKAKFKQLGSAFVISENTAHYHPVDLPFAVLVIFIC